MSLELLILPCRTDNFAYFLHDAASGATLAIDAPEAGPMAAALGERGWKLSEIWLTHHHGDHVEAVEELRAAHGATVTGHAADAHRLPRLDRALRPGDALEFAGVRAEMIDVSGHTLGHVAYHLPSEALAFTGDSLMALGCGRLFEGTAPQMWNSLSRLMALPDSTRILSGHDYIAGNAAFAASVEPENAARDARVTAKQAGGPEAVHVTLGEEKATNPFLRVGDRAIRNRLGMDTDSDEDVFAELRRRKDAF